MMAKFNEKVDKIREKTSEKNLFISTVPKKTKTRFMELAKEEFENHYGFLLKKMVEVYDSIYPTGNEEIEGKIDVLADQIVALNEKVYAKEPKKKNVIKSVSGRNIIEKEE